MTIHSPKQLSYHGGCICQKYLAHFIAIIYGMQPWTIARDRNKINRFDLL